MIDPRVRIKRSVNDLRLVGFLLLLLSIAPIYLFGYSRLMGRSPLEVLPAMIVLVVPAAVFIVGSVLVPRNSVLAATWVMRVAFVQPVLVVGSVGLAIQMRSRAFGFGGGLGVFFVPAVIALAFQLRRALRDIHLLPEAQHGFTPLIATSPPPLPVRDSPAPPGHADS